MNNKKITIYKDIEFYTQKELEKLIDEYMNDYELDTPEQAIDYIYQDRIDTTLENIIDGIYNKIKKDEPVKIIGYIQKWNGQHKIKPDTQENLYDAILKCVQDYNIIEQTPTKIFIQAFHHDGTNKFIIYQPDYKTKKDQARQKAIEQQQINSELSLSYNELLQQQEYFYKLGKRYGLLKEFKKNCII